MSDGWASGLARGACLAAVGIGVYDASFELSASSPASAVAVAAMSATLTAPLVIAVALAFGWSLDVLGHRDTALRRVASRMAEGRFAELPVPGVVAAVSVFCVVDWIGVAVADRVLDSDEYRTRAAFLAVLAGTGIGCLAGAVVGRLFPTPTLGHRALGRVAVALVAALGLSLLVLTPVVARLNWPLVGIPLVVFGSLAAGLTLRGAVARGLLVASCLVFVAGFVLLFSSDLRDTLAADSLIARQHLDDPDDDGDESDEEVEDDEGMENDEVEL